MNRKSLIRLILASVAVLLLQACASAPTSGPAALTGTWTNSLGTVWIMHPDGSFDVDLNHDGKRDAWGKCAVEGNTVTVTRVGGINPKGCQGAGVYHFTRTSNALHFTLVKDACKIRVKNVTSDWQRK